MVRVVVEGRCRVAPMQKTNVIDAQREEKEEDDKNDEAASLHDGGQPLVLLLGQLAAEPKILIENADRLANLRLAGAQPIQRHHGRHQFTGLAVVVLLLRLLVNHGQADRESAGPAGLASAGSRRRCGGALVHNAASLPSHRSPTNKRATGRVIVPCKD